MVSPDSFNRSEQSDIVGEPRELVPRVNEDRAHAILAVGVARPQVEGLHHDIEVTEGKKTRSTN